jgi:hypothetical protein
MLDVDFAWPSHFCFFLYILQNKLNHIIGDASFKFFFCQIVWPASDINTRAHSFGHIIKKCRLDDILWHDIHSRFNENASLSLNVIRHRHTKIWRSLL